MVVEEEGVFPPQDIVIVWDRLVVTEVLHAGAVQEQMWRHWVQAASIDRAAAAHAVDAAVHNFFSIYNEFVRIAFAIFFILNYITFK